MRTTSQSLESLTYWSLCNYHQDEEEVLHIAIFGYTQDSNLIDPKHNPNRNFCT